MRKSLLAVAVVAVTLSAGCADLTHPDEIRIIAEPPAAAAARPNAPEAAKPAGATDGGEKGNKMKAPAQVAPKAAGDPHASCGG